MKICFFGFHPLEFGGGLEGFYLWTAVGLTKADSSLRISIVNVPNNTYERFGKLVAPLLHLRVSRIIYREDRKEISNILEDSRVKWQKVNLGDLRETLENFDVVYAKSDVVEMSILKWIVGYKNLPSVIIGVHTSPFYPVTKSLSSKLHNFFYGSFMYEYLAKQATAFHVINTSDEELFQKRFPHKKVIRIPPRHLDVEEFKKKAQRYKYRKFIFDGTKLNIAWTGRLTEQKGVDDLIRIVTEVNRTKYQKLIAWNIMGEGELKELVLGLESKFSNVNYFGHVEYKYMANILSRNDLLISTSKWEGLPQNILEAQAMDLPVISFSIPGSSDIVQDKRTGFLVDSAKEFILRIKEFADEKYDFKDISSSIEKRFSPQNVFGQLISMFKGCARTQNSKDGL